MAGTLIQPLKINRPSGRAVPQLNIAADFGVERNVASKLEELFQKKQKQDLIQAETFGQQFAASMSKMILDRDNQGKINKKLFHNFDSYNSLESEIKSNIEQFKKDGKELGIDDSILEKYSSMVTGELEKSNVNYLVEYNDYNTKVQKNEAEFILAQKKENLNTRFLNGDYTEGINNFYSLVDDLEKMIDAEFITKAKAIETLGEQIPTLIESNIMSYENMPGGEELLIQMDKWTPEEFIYHYKDLQFSSEFGEVRLGIDEYKKFKSTISSSINRIENRKKMAGEMTLAEQIKDDMERKTKPREYYIKKSKLPKDYPVPESVQLQIINEINGTSVSSVEEANMLGLDMGWQEKGFDNTDHIYDNTTLNGASIMNDRAEAMVKNTGSYGSKEISEDYLDSTNKNIAGGSMLTRAYFSQSEVQSLYNDLYDSTNRQTIESFKGIEVANFDGIEKFNISSEVALAYENVLNSYYVKESTTPAAGATLEALNAASLAGDKASNRFIEDFEKMYSDSIKVELFRQTGGILTKDLAKKADLEVFDVTLDSLNKEQKTKVLQAFYNENDDVRKNVDRKMASIIPKIINYKTVDTGKYGMILTDENANADEIAKGINTFVADNEFYINGTNIRKKELRVSSKPGANVAVFMYGGMVAQDKDGKPIILKLGGIND